MQGLITLWSIIGTIYLIFLTYQDLRYKMTIDDRKNYFMMGLTISLVTVSASSFLYKVIALIVSLILIGFINKLKLLASGDSNTIFWVFYGFALLDARILVVWLVVLGSISLMQAFIKYIFVRMGKLKKKQPIPYFPVLLCAFIVTAIVTNIYI